MRGQLPAPALLHIRRMATTNRRVVHMGSQPVVVVGETECHYRIQAPSGGEVLLVRQVLFGVGTCLVPKQAISFQFPSCM